MPSDADWVDQNVARLEEQRDTAITALYQAAHDLIDRAAYGAARKAAESLEVLGNITAAQSIRKRILGDRGC